MSGDLRDTRQELAGVRVLLVDDHADTRDLYRQVLAHHGATVTATGRAAVAAAICGAVAVDIVVTDVSMPELDGVWLLEQVRARAPGIPVIGVSGYAKDQTPSLEAAVFDLLLLKPVDPLNLAENIADVLQQRKAPP